MNLNLLNVVDCEVIYTHLLICENDDALKMKNNQLAQYLHMTPETLSRILKKFTKLGFLEKKNSLYTIINKEALIILFE